jgi:hypothetical protein
MAASVAAIVVRAERLANDRLAVGIEMLTSPGSARG